MPLDLSALARQMREAAESSAGRERDLAERIDAAVDALHEQTREHLAERVAAHTRRPWLAGVPIDEPTFRRAAPPPPESYVVLSTDGSHLDPDHHDALACWLMNVGTAVIGYGAEPTARLETKTTLGHTLSDLYVIHDEQRLRVEGQLLNVRRQVAEVEALAELCEEYPGGVALVDGTLLLTSISRTIQAEPTFFLQTYLAQMERIRRTGSIVASYISRPRASDVVGALRVGVCPLTECDVVCRTAESSARPCARLTDVSDRLLFAATGLDPGERSGVWRSTWRTSEQHYGEHAVHFFYCALGDEIARVEVPGWVATSAAAVDRLHAVLVAQSRLGDGGYPRVLIEAHHKAVITAGDRRSFDVLMEQAVGARYGAALRSAKARAKRRRAV